jgi:hypothetical protein
MDIDLIIGKPDPKIINNPKNVYKLTVISDFSKIKKSILLYEAESVIERIKLLIFWFNTVNELWDKNYSPDEENFINYNEVIIGMLENETYKQKFSLNTKSFWNSICGLGDNKYSQPESFEVNYFDPHGVELPVRIIVDGKSLGNVIHLKKGE